MLVLTLGMVGVASYKGETSLTVWTAKAGRTDAPHQPKPPTHKSGGIIMTDQLTMFSTEPLAPLYKRSATGKIQVWRTWVVSNTIHVEHGQLDGVMQHDVEVIAYGKCIGQANATTASQQAAKEAKARWTKKHAKDYYLNISDIPTTKSSKLGGYLPMLAQTWYATKASGKVIDNRHKVNYPCYLSPKLDGMRMVSQKSAGIVTLWSRDGKQIKTLPHIEAELVARMQAGEIWDGEMYDHDGDFQEFTGAARAIDVSEKQDILKSIAYHVYDAPRIGRYIEADAFCDRFAELSTRIAKYNGPHIKLVPCTVITHVDEIMPLHDLYVSEGYEGAMLRNLRMPYAQTRSYDLLKVKQFQDDEYLITGYKEGHGKFAGMVVFECTMDDGQTFDVVMSGKREYLRQLFQNPEYFMGKMLTVKHQGWTNAGKPRCPTGKAIREDNDDVS